MVTRFLLKRVALLLSRIGVYLLMSGDAVHYKFREFWLSNTER
jgi:hypothetical protein